MSDSISIKGVCENCNGDSEYSVTTTKKGVKYHIYACLDENCGHYTYVKLSESSVDIEE